jgi:methanogenic corrinoid protein MtbC1
MPELQFASTTKPLNSVDRVAANSNGSAWLSTLTYRSKAVAPMSELELYRLARAAQIRNRSEGVTGLVIYDKGNFFQWLEGPAESLGRIWSSVRRDPRHTSIEIMGNQRTPVRFFGDWDMRLSTRGAAAGMALSASFDAGSADHEDARQGAAFDISRDVIENLYSNPRAAPALLARLSPTLLARPVPVVANAPLAAELSNLVSLVIPRLAQRLLPVRGHGLAHAFAHGLPPAHPRVAELARLLVEADPAAAKALVRHLYGTNQTFASLYASVFEPAARALGDLWDDDDCSEFDVTLGLGRLQSSILALSDISAQPEPRLLSGLPSVLVVPQPGEIHRLSAALDSDLLWRAGWDTHAEFPATDHALDALVAGNWFDALDLSLSAAFQREHWLPRLSETIAHARTASLNPAIVVVVGGRVFAELGATSDQVGADASCASAVQVETRILQALQKGLCSAD